jgi:protein required for attachment to host cells
LVTAANKVHAIDGERTKLGRNSQSPATTALKEPISSRSDVEERYVHSDSAQILNVTNGVSDKVHSDQHSKDYGNLLRKIK